MSKYTTSVRFICEEFSGLSESVGYYKINEVIEKARERVFCFDYPIFDEKYRSVLETKILKHYYTKEIGFETTALWQLKLETKLNEIMPYYNQLYNSELLEYNPLEDVNVVTTRTVENNGETDTIGETESNYNNTSNTDSETKNNGTSWDLYSDTPQGSVQNLENETYLTNARKISNNETTNNNTDSTTNGTSNIDTTNNTTVKNIEDYLEEVKGKRGSHTYSELIIKYRETFLNIDMMIIDELADLFMLLW